MRVGFTWRIITETLITLKEDLTRLRQLGFNVCVCGIRYPVSYHNGETGKMIQIVRETGLELHSLWCGFGGSSVFNLAQGPATVGLVPQAYREERLKILEECARFAQEHGVKKIATHHGFTPECHDDPRYEGFVATIQRAADIVAQYDCKLLLETGQETPTTLLRLLEDAGRENLGVDLDVGNLVQYGRGEPCGAIDVLKDHIWRVDAKDGRYPTGGRVLGVEVPCGEGVVNFNGVIGKLLDIGYDGDIMIEREISGEQKILDLTKAKGLLESIIREEKEKRSLS